MSIADPNKTILTGENPFIRFARTVRKSGAIPTSAAIWSRCAPPRSRQAIRPRRGGRASGEPGQMSMQLIDGTDPLARLVAQKTK